MRKKNWLLTMLMLVATMAMPSMIWAQEMYTVYDTTTKTLTFKYDNDKPESTDNQKVYDVPTISADIYTTPDWITNHNSAITTVVFDATFAEAQPTSCYQWFKGCKVLTDIQNIENLNTAKVTSMRSMFSGCEGLTSLDLSKFNTANVESMDSMFYHCSKLTSLDLSKFNTDKVTDMKDMFNFCLKLTSLDLSKFNTDKVTDLSSMFYRCDVLTSLDLSNFNTANVTNMQFMFFYCSKLKSLDLSKFNTANVTSMSYMFSNCESLTSLTLSSSFNTAKVKGMNNMFNYCLKLESLNLSSFNTANVTSMSSMFSHCEGLTSLDLSSFNTANVTTMYYMFDYCKSLTSLDLSKFNTDKVTNMSFMFNNCYSLKSLILSSNFNTANVTNMARMFYYCQSLESLDLSSFNTAKVTSTMGNMFYECSKLKSLKLSSSFSTANVTDMNNMFYNCQSLESLDLSSFNTAKVTKMSNMFNNCYSLKSLKLSSNFNTANVTEMTQMFYYCQSLKSLDLSSFNTAKVTDMEKMFYYCSDLKSLDLSKFNTANVFYMSYMFSNCSSLESLDLSSFNTDKVSSSNMKQMFFNCSSLKSLDLSSFNTANVTDMENMFFWCSNLTTIYVSDSFKTDRLYHSSSMFSNCIKLVGAINYNSQKTDKAGASYVTGYFTYAIKTAENLKSFAECVNTAGKEAGAAALLADIKLTADDSFTPIGSNAYKGNFDGLGHSISGLNFSESTYNCLFNNNAGTIKNMGVVNAKIAEGSTGCICSSNTGTISNCFFMGTTEGTTTPNGAVCQTNNGTITNCYNLAGNDDGNGGKTTEQFASGEVCYLLSQGTEGSVWGQQLGEDGDAYPVLASDNKVYYGYENCTSRIYSNTVLSDTPVHNYDNGICKVCNVYQPATKNESDEYEIGNAGQLYWFAGLVNGTLDGVIQNKSAKAILTDDITFTNNFTAIGNAETCMYEGTFDGKGHTVTVNQNLSNDVALFGYIGTCTIKNLKVTGTINTNVKYAAGIAMKKVGNTTTANIENCLSDIVIKSTLVGDGTHGGIIGNVDGTINIKNCAFTGKMEGSDTNSCGGIIGWTQGTANITNSYVSATFTISNSSSNIASRGSGSINVTNCYYVYLLGGTVKGITNVAENTVTTGKLCIILNNGTSDGTQPFGQQLEVDKYPIPGSAYKLITASKGDHDTYWSTFSNLTNDVTLSVPKDRTLAVYNVTVSGSTMTLRKRSDNQVAKEEGVLLKSNGEYVNVKANETNELTPVGYANNNLVATPAEATTITADAGYTLYRLTYNNVTYKTDLGFYLGGADGVKDGSKLKATPGKAYLKVSNSASGSAPLRGFIIGEDDNTTGIDVITINGIDINGVKVDDNVYDLMGRKVSKPAKGIYIKNGKKIIIK